MHELLSKLFDELFPICRSISGPGLRESLDILGRHMPLVVESVETGTKVFDWTVPPEWHIKSARLSGPDNRIWADLDESNLHVVNYSEPFDGHIAKEELMQHLYSLPEQPEAIPYVTSYYKRNWGFCISHDQLQRMPDGLYHAQIDSEFVPGGVDFAQSVLAGDSSSEILLSSYLCHPSLANNELSGPLVLLGLYKRLSAWPSRRYTYRFVLNSETIGSLCFLFRYGEHLRKHMTAGMVLTCLGGPNETLSYKTSRRGDSLLDQVVATSNQRDVAPVRIRPFDPRSGSDERQYCSPGFNLPVGQMARTVYGKYDGYHNSLDTKEWMQISSLVRSIDEIENLLRSVESAGYFCNLSPFGEPQLGKRGLYPSVNSAATWTASSDTSFDARTILDRILTILNYSDGEHTMLQIAEMCGCTLQDLEPVIFKLEAAGLLAHTPHPATRELTS